MEPRNPAINRNRVKSRVGKLGFKEIILLWVLVWVRLKSLVARTGRTIYQIKHGLLSNYLIEQLKRPQIPMFIV